MSDRDKNKIALKLIVNMFKSTNRNRIVNMYDIWCILKIKVQFSDLEMF